MKNENIGQRGSALLIVLGMLSFMIVSAVAFSVYMRMSRAPSSYLRRNVATQHLTKAALARAIEEIDNYIGNDPYPGFGNNAKVHRRYNSSDGYSYEGREDAWTHRVFCPYANVNGDTQVTKNTGSSSSSSGEHCIEFNDTIAVLSLEELGYIPTPIVNQVRYWSRRSATARWRRFNYDLGRWAYNAVDVSDFFDVNVIRAYTNRNSGAFGRITLHPLFDKLGGDGAARKFDEFTESPGELDVPLTSVLDYNLAIDQKSVSGNLESPFCKWLDSTKIKFYKDFDYKVLSNIVFVTDSWLPPTNQFAKGGKEMDDYYYLSRSDDQPFTKFENNKGFLEFFKTAAPSWTGESFDVLSKQFRAVGVACLYDYLDRDSVPLSLALPCTEQTPMIVGVYPDIRNMEFTITKPTTQTIPPSAPGQPQREMSEFMVKMDNAEINVKAMLMFPFKRWKRKDETFQLQAIVRVYFGAKDMPLRAESSDSPLHPDPTNSDTWKENTFKFEKSIYTFVSPLTSNLNIVEGDDDKLMMGDMERTFIYDSKTMIKFNAKVSDTPHKFFKYTKETNNGQDKHSFDFTSSELLPYAKSGKTAAWTGTKFDDINDEIIPYVAVWVRVVDKDGKTTDLVPATLQDDNLNWELGLTPSQAASIGGKVCGPGIPLFNFKLKDESKQTFYPSTSTASDDIAKNPYLNGDLPHFMFAHNKETAKNDDKDYDALRCYDPRYNFAPEDWHVSSEGDISPSRWLDDVKGKLLGKDGRDADVFMFVSNQEYLQSLGEFAFVPRTQSLKWKDRTGGSVTAGDFFDAGRYNGKEKTFIDSEYKKFNPSNAANYEFFWRTYCSYDQRGYDTAISHPPKNGETAKNGMRDPIYELMDSAGNRILDDDGLGPRVNPYTSSDTIFKLALQDTPYDYWAASTNKVTDVGPNFSSPKEALKYCFGEKNNQMFDMLSDDEIDRIAKTLKRKFRYEDGDNIRKDGDWLAGYDELDWHGRVGDDNYGAYFLNSEEETKRDNDLKDASINEVDRKFLYSFWRNCFANRQQLFLVFVRAEPNVFGGAQQGSRAVALVWRDPATPVGYADRTSRQDEIAHNKNKNDRLPPHRTRILFYHQFE